jgi:hypothetical protein
MTSNYNVQKAIKAAEGKKPQSINKVISTRSSKKLYYLSIRVRQNNIFCFVGEILTNRTIFKLSSGNLNINLSKKTLKFNSKKIIPHFFSLLSKNILNLIFLINLITPRFLKRRFFKQIGKFMKKTKHFFFLLNGKKSFNGCRVKKYKRKKRHKFRIFKVI